jgi:putative solute:sodium symporter small subunit
VSGFSTRFQETRQDRERGQLLRGISPPPKRQEGTPRCSRVAVEGRVGPMAESKIADSKANETAHWDKTTRLMFTHLGVWFFFGYVIHMFVVPLNKITIPILGFPLGFYMAAQGSLIVFVVMLFMFAKQQNKIDRDHGYAEED